MNHESRIDEGGSGLPCPVCSETMTPREVQGVLVATCDKHGMWLEPGDLDRIRRKGFASGRNRRRASLDRMRRDARLEGWIFGFWSLFRR